MKKGMFTNLTRRLASIRETEAANSNQNKKICGREMGFEENDTHASPATELQRKTGRNSLAQGSPTSRLGREEREVKIEKERDSWESTCCGRTKKCSKHLLQFIMQAFISVTVLLFCMAQLALDRDTENKAVYFSLLSGMVTLYINPPTPKNSTNSHSA